MRTLALTRTPDSIQPTRRAINDDNDRTTHTCITVDVKFSIHERSSQSTAQVVYAAHSWSQAVFYPHTH